MEIVLVLVVSVCNIFSFLAGAFVARAVKGEKTLNPITAIKQEKKQKKERAQAERKKQRYEVMMSNIDSYNGTGEGQIDLPKEVL